MGMLRRKSPPEEFKLAKMRQNHCWTCVSTDFTAFREFRQEIGAARFSPSLGGTSGSFPSIRRRIENSAFVIEPSVTVELIITVENIRVKLGQRCFALSSVEDCHPQS
jgi:hypothetical protein